MIDLKSYPYFVLDYSVQDNSVQTIQILYGIQTDKNEEVYTFIPRTSYPEIASQKRAVFVVDLLRKAEDLLPGSNHYYLKYIEILPHKLWKINCSGKKSGEYVFNFYGMSMVNSIPSARQWISLARSPWTARRLGRTILPPRNCSICCRGPT